MAPPEGYFDLEPGFETEIFQNKRFGKLRLATEELICVAMAARILFLLKNEHSSSCIPCHILTEFNVEIDSETIRAVVEKDFEVTEEDLSTGEYMVATAPPIRGPGYHGGHILPAGIAYECINLRDYGVGFVMQYAQVQWGLSVPEHVVATLIDDWVLMVTRVGDGVPDDARPHHEGRRITQLALQPYPELEQRDVLFQHAPPQYEPRPIYRNNSGQEVLLRHPREIPDSYPRGSRARDVPTYRDGEAPPAYSDRQPHSTVSAPPSSSSRQEVHPVTTYADSEHRSTISNSSAEAVIPKGRHFVETDIVTYSKIDNVNYLFFNMPAVLLDDELGPLTFPHVSRDFRRFLLLTMLGRTRPIHVVEMWPQYRLGSTGGLTLSGKRVAKLVRDIVNELKVSACATSRRILAGMPIIDNREGLLILLRHMQRARGVRELGNFVSDSAFWRAAFEEIKIADNLHVQTILKRDPVRVFPTVSTLERLLDDIRNLRSEDKSFQVTFQFSRGTPRILVSVAGVDTQPALSIGELEGDRHHQLSGHEYRRYVNLLEGARNILQGAIGAMSDESFIVARHQLERFVRAGVRTVAHHGESVQQLQEALERVHTLSNSKEASRINPEYWAAIMTNSSLAIVGLLSTSRAWVIIPTSDEPPRQLAFVYRPKPLASMSTHSFRFHLNVIKNIHRLGPQLMHTFTPPSEVSLTMEQFHQEYDNFLVQWEAYKLTYLPGVDDYEFEHLNKAYKRGLARLYDIIGRIEGACSAATAECKAALRQELSTNLKLRHSFVDRIASCERSPFAPDLDLDIKEVKIAMNRYSTEFLRVQAWYLKGNQRPMDPAYHEDMATELDQMLTDLEADLAWFELEAAEEQDEAPEEHDDIAAVTSVDDVETRPESSHALAIDQTMSSAEEDETASSRGSDEALRQDEEVPIPGRVVYASAPTHGGQTLPQQHGNTVADQSFRSLLEGNDDSSDPSGFQNADIATSLPGSRESPIIADDRASLDTPQVEPSQAEPATSDASGTLTSEPQSSDEVSVPDGGNASSSSATSESASNIVPHGHPTGPLQDNNSEDQGQEGSDQESQPEFSDVSAAVVDFLRRWRERARLRRESR
ncbi:hypothetical protein H2204_003673 [Knufia peltigerae]|uniref:Uncharacterized protein n=1 Tax=Knufia peltigerae TaxID=1002370 RepID=A0AA38Y8Q2_9EURO|nr:hypothetical protein H2204_003673 [Knufia peltigerae]